MCYFNYGIALTLLSVTVFFLPGYLKVKKGQLTFNWEGNNNKKSRHYSRKPSVPSSSSGITIGRGYDMGKKSKQQVFTDLIKAGISDKLAELLAKGAELVGKVAEAFLQVS